MKRFISLMVLVICSLSVSAYDIAVKNADGVTIYYDYRGRFDGEKYVEDLIVAQGGYSGDLVIPEEVKLIDKTLKVIGIGKGAFFCLGRLNSVSLPKSILSIGYYAFQQCTGLTSITIPERVERLEYNVFAACTSLTSIVIPDSVTYIEDNAFLACSNLETVTLGKGVKYIGDKAFEEGELKTIYSHIEKPFRLEHNDGIFSERTLKNATLYVPVGTIDKYKTTRGWKEFKNIEEWDCNSNSEPHDIPEGNEPTDNNKEWVTISDDFDKSIPFTKIRVLNSKSSSDQYCCVAFSTKPNEDVGIDRFYINFSSLTIGDNNPNSISWGNPITNYKHVGGNWYEYEFSCPVYFAYRQHNCPSGQVMALIQKNEQDSASPSDEPTPNVGVVTKICKSYSQPPIVGGIISDYSEKNIKEKGFIVSDNSNNLNYDANSKESAYGYIGIRDFKVIDCTEYGKEQFWCPLRGLKADKTYYVKAYIIQSNGDIMYGGTESIHTQRFNRYKGTTDYANVWYAFKNTLFDLVTDEIINPNEGFYYSTNERPTSVRHQIGTSYNTCYKFKTEWNYKLWYYHSMHCVQSKRINPPLLTFQGNKLYIEKNPLDMDKNITIFYSINGDYFRPENYADVYDHPIKIYEPCIVYCFAKSSEGYISFTNMYVINNNQEDPTIDKVANYDIEEIKNYIMGNPSANFNMELADYNGDGVVNVADIVSIIDNNKWITVTDNFSKSIPFTKIRVLNNKSISDQYCCVAFSTSPNEDVGTDRFYINFSSLTIGDNNPNSISWDNPITNYKHVGGNWYEYEFSRPVYFAFRQHNCPSGQVKVCIDATYTQLDYIERGPNHTAEINNIGVTLSDNMKFQLKVYPTNGGGQWIIGNDGTNDKDDYRVFWAGSNEAGDAKIYYDYGDDGVPSVGEVGRRLLTASTISNLYELEVGNYYVKDLTNNNYILSGSTVTNANVNRTIGVFGNNDFGRIYYLKVFDGNTLIKNLIPVRRDCDGFVTLYDTISKTYMNTVAGTFKASDE